MSTDKLNYPATRKGEQVDNYHGTEVADPYRWLENLDSEDTKAWVEAQNKVTFNYLKQIPVRDDIKKRLTKLWDYEKYGVPFREGNRYFYFKNDGLQNQSVLYTLKNLEDEPQVLLNANKLSEDGTVALSGISVSDDGKYLAYGISIAGSDW
ncbi:MAG: S9 family peptidase, partial [Cyanobacteria bacterium P01_D01_bin.116]